MIDAKLPIGVFDSGMGGPLCCVPCRLPCPVNPSSILVRCAPSYGNKTTETVQEYALQASAALVERGIKALVIARNTALQQRCR